MTGNVGFLMAESEWARIIMEMGPLIGMMFIALRIAMVLYLGLKCRSATKRHKDALPILLFAAAFPLVLNGQLNPPTILGFAVFIGGLCLAAAKHPPEGTFAPVRRF